MIQLPDSLTVAALGAALGLVLGLGAGYWVWHTPDQGASELPKLPGTWALERDRPLQPRDTAGQAEPDVEIRYRTRTDTIQDTVHVPVSTGLTGDPVVSSRTPLQLSPEIVTHTYWDPTDRQFEQRRYRVPKDRYRISAYAVGLRRFQPRPTLQAGIGLKARIDPQWLPGAIEPFGEVRAGREVVATTGLRWHLVEL
jgi:hypothetical protein